MPPKKSKAPAAVSSIFSGLVFSFAGTFSCAQSALSNLVVENGGEVSSGVSKAVTHVVTTPLPDGDRSEWPTKVLSAIEKGLKLVSEEWIRAAIKDGALPTDDALLIKVPAEDDSEKDDKKGDKKEGDKKEGDKKEDEEKKDDNSASTSPSGDADAPRRSGRAKRKVDDDTQADASAAAAPVPKKRGRKAASVTSDDADDSKKDDAKKDDDKKDDDKKDDDKKDDKSGASSSAKSASHRTFIMKGKVPVDTGCNLASTHHVLDENGEVWDACLNQTNIGANNNKFYNIQLLCHDHGGQYYVWNRWGRLGEPGQNSLKPFGGNLEGAKTSFRSKFNDKTRQRWESKANFEPQPGKYTLIERDFGGDEGEGDKKDDDDKDDDEDDDAVSEKNKKESILPERVKDIVSLICDLKMMKRQMMEIGYDANKMPLGKLSKAHLDKGYAALDKISTAIQNKANIETLRTLSSQFYTLIPHVAGRQRLPEIQTLETVKEKLDMLDSLADVSLATKLLKDNKKSDRNPVDERYEALKCQLTPLDKSSEDYQNILKYVKNTHGATHTSYDLEVEDVFEVNRKGDFDSFEPFAQDPGRYLLWHGSRLSNFTGILSQGLRIAPPEAPITGYMFGKGVYFADSVSKSANYCATSRVSNTACMLLCEVALGKSQELTQASYHASNLPPGISSTKGLGRSIPDPAEFVQTKDGITIPLGHMIPCKIQSSSLLYNEYIVYSTAQIRMKYLIKMKFNYSLF